MPKATIIQDLCDREGYSPTLAKKIVNTFVQVIKEALAAGKDVEIDGLALCVVRRRPKCTIEKNLRNVGTTIIRRPRHMLGVKLGSRVDLSYKE
jgi:nucleoid DNA-binding protein